MNRNNGIDLFKLIGAFFVMCLHTSYGSLNQEYVDNLRLFSRWAIPFFFIATGFFLGNKFENKSLDFKRIQKNVIALISILIVSSIIYIPIDFITGNFYIKITNILTGTYFHLWFIGSLLTGYIFIWYLYYIKMNKLLPIISIFIIILALFTDSYDQFINKNIGFDMFRFLLSVPFMYIGIIISKKRINIRRYKFLIGLVFIGLIIQYAEAELFLNLFKYEKYTHQFLIGTIVIAIALSLFLVSSNLNIRDNIFSQWGKEHSLFIYLYHPIIYLITWTVLERLIPNYYDSIKIFSPLIGFAIILTFSIVLNRFFPKIYNILNGKFINVDKKRKNNPIQVY